jgi:hypothetical protein
VRAGSRSDSSFRSDIIHRRTRTPFIVMPAKAGIHRSMDPRFRGDDEGMIQSPYGTALPKT